MDVILKTVTRENWLEALALGVNDDQAQFTPSVAVSLAKVYIKPDGDNVNYIPFAIYHNDKMVGFIMHAYEEDTKDQYWINGFLIDKRHQGKGYGNAALEKMIKYIRDTQEKCNKIKLSVHRENKNAYQLYKKYGFKETGDFIGEDIILCLSL